LTIALIERLRIVSTLYAWKARKARVVGVWKRSVERSRYAVGGLWRLKGRGRAWAVPAGWSRGTGAPEALGRRGRIVGPIGPEGVGGEAACARRRVRVPGPPGERPSFRLRHVGASGSKEAGVRGSGRSGGRPAYKTDTSGEWRAGGRGTCPRIRRGRRRAWPRGRAGRVHRDKRRGVAPGCRWQGSRSSGCGRSPSERHGAGSVARTSEAGA
jgi:hypothetical protein